MKESIKRSPLTHSVINNLHLLEPGVQQYSMAPEVQAVATTLSHVVKPEELQEEFMDCCTFHLPESVKMSNAVDEYWHTVSKIKDISGEECHFPTLTKLAKATLLIPQANADTE